MHLEYSFAGALALRTALDYAAAFRLGPPDADPHRLLQPSVGGESPSKPPATSRPQLDPGPDWSPTLGIGLLAPLALVLLLRLRGHKVSHPRTAER